MKTVSGPSLRSSGMGADLGPEGRIPAYGGALFDEGQTALVEHLAWGDDTAAQVLDKLTRVPARDRGRLAALLSGAGC